MNDANSEYSYDSYSGSDYDYDDNSDQSVDDYDNSTSEKPLPQQIYIDSVVELDPLRDGKTNLSKFYYKLQKRISSMQDQFPWLHNELDPGESDEDDLPEYLGRSWWPLAYKKKGLPPSPRAVTRMIAEKKGIGSEFLTVESFSVGIQTEVALSFNFSARKSGCQTDVRMAEKETQTWLDADEENYKHSLIQHRLNSHAWSQAATRVQRALRGWIVRKHFRKMVTAIRLIQKLIRGFRQRRRYQNLLRLLFNSPESAALQARIRIMRYICQTERPYRFCLQQLDVNYLGPLLARCQPGMSNMNEEEYRAIFQNLSQIYHFHNQFGDALNDAFDASPWIPPMSPIFLKYGAELLQAYSTYIVGYLGAKKRFERLCTEDSFTYFCLSLQARCGSSTPSLRLLMMLPLHRFSDYVMTLRYCVEMEGLVGKQLAPMLDRFISVWKTLQGQAMHGMIELSNRFDKNVKVLLAPNRFYIHHGFARVGVESIITILCNDILIWASPQKHSNVDESIDSSISKWVWKKTVKLVDVDVSAATWRGAPDHSLVVKVDSGWKLTLAFATAELKILWSKEISDAIRLAKGGMEGPGGIITDFPVAEMHLSSGMSNEVEASAVGDVF